jgi:hypothetical protein
MNNNTDKTKNTCNVMSKEFEEQYKTISCNDITDANYDAVECNLFLRNKENLERFCLKTEPTVKSSEFTDVYPNLNDASFNVKIAEKKEFNDTQYDGTVHENIKKHADMLNNADFELQPHQSFVKNFLSSQTPYSSLLLYHGLGTGKTCSAIGVCEEMRDYLKQMGTVRRILIVASENVQDNFKLQLFDERKLKEVDGVWTMASCLGNKLVKEVNPTNMKGISKETMVNQINALIKTSYLFLGYGEFANYIIRTMGVEEDDTNKKRTNRDAREKGKKQQPKGQKDIVLTKRMVRNLQHEFGNRLIVIDEVHNIRMTDDNKNKKVAIQLEYLVKCASNIRLLLLSATPMYNSYKEIIWLLNLLNMNDRRSTIQTSDVFDANGEFKENGKELLMQKATGYVSYVRGDNPYTFPYRVYPKLFAKSHTFEKYSYPTYQMNGKRISEKDNKRILDIYLSRIGNCKKCGICQYCAYKYIINYLRNKEYGITTKKGVRKIMPNFANMESFGYSLLQIPLESLIISYPMDGLRENMEKMHADIYSEELEDNFVEEIKELSELKKSDVEESDEPVDADEAVQLGGVITTSNLNESSISDTDDDSELGYVNIHPSDLTGKKGLKRMMQFVDQVSPPKKGDFEYRKITQSKYGRIFSKNLIGKYSSKIKSVLDNIVSDDGIVSEGIILIYSQYIDSGLIPMALALEEMGFLRYGQDTKELFKTKPTDPVDVRTMKPPTSKKDFIPARYSFITGDPKLSPNNDYEVKGLTNKDNMDGHRVKVVLISKAGSEGIDFKYIRQVHILDPWYNINRIEQIIGRAVRNFSHKDLPFEKRNVEIFLHGTLLEDNVEEAADLYVYRLAEYKAVQMGKVSRALKQSAVDCLLNAEQMKFTQEIISSVAKGTITQVLSNMKEIPDFKIGDEPYSPGCDYMKTCNYECVPTVEKDEDDKFILNINNDTYNEFFIQTNYDKINQKIKMLMKEGFFYKKDVLVDLICIPKKYPLSQIYYVLSQMVEDSSEKIEDKYGRPGNLVNIGDYYLFQPSELTYKNTSLYERMMPVDYKNKEIVFELKKEIAQPIETEFVEMEKYKDYSVGKQWIEDFKTRFGVVREYAKKEKAPRGDDDWYKHCGVAMKKMTTKYYIDVEVLFEMLIDHMIELLLYEDKLELMNYIYSLKNVESGTIEGNAKKYFETHCITMDGSTVFVLYELNKRKYAVLNNQGQWTLANEYLSMDFDIYSQEHGTFSFDASEYNEIVGFMGFERNNKYLTFKTKNITSSRDTGARCDEAGKMKTIDILNKIIGTVEYTKENTQMLKDETGKKVLREAISHIELCVIQEMLLRYYNKTKHNNIFWFMTPEMALEYKMYKIFV